MADLETRLEALEARLQEAEDRLAIYQLLAAYGPAVDSLAGDALRDLWEADGVYDADGGPFVGADAVGGIVRLPSHRECVAAGCAHLVAMPHVKISGDAATAVGYSCLNVFDGEQWIVVRTSANKWELVRENKGWKVSRRTNRTLNGDEEACDILASAFAPGENSASGR